MLCSSCWFYFFQWNFVLELWFIGIDESRERLTKWQVPIFDGSAKEWVDAIEEVGIIVAQNHVGETVEKMVAQVNKPMYVCKNDSFVAAFPALETRITCGIDFPQVLQSNDILRIQKKTNFFRAFA